MDSTAWGAIGVVITLIAVAWTWYAFRNRGLASGLRGVSFVGLAIGAWLTNTFELLGRLLDSIGDWAVRLVFSPTVWVGIAVAGVSFLLFLVTLRMSDGSGRRPRSVGEKQTDAERGRSRSASKRGATTGRDGGVADTLGDDADDIDAILRKHGIS